MRSSFGKVLVPVLLFSILSCLALSLPLLGPNHWKHNVRASTKLRSRDLDHKIEKRFTFLFRMLFPVIIRGLQATLYIGMRLLQATAVAAYNWCRDYPLDCFKTANYAVGFAFGGQFAANNGINGRDVNGGTVYSLAHLNNSFSHVVTHVAFHNKTTLVGAAVSQHTDDIWLRLATLHVGEVPAYHIHHHLTHHDDLGRENDGTIHQLRASSTKTEAVLGRREEWDDNGVVVDYLWRAGQLDVWEDIADKEASNNFADTFGQGTGQWMEDNRAEASCASVVSKAVINEGGLTQKVDENHGVLAYGWNDAAFNFNGRAGGGWMGVPIDVSIHFIIRKSWGSSDLVGYV